MKKIKIACFLIVITIIGVSIMACSNHEKETTIESTIEQNETSSTKTENTYEREQLTLLETIKISPYIFCAQVNSITQDTAGNACVAVTISDWCAGSTGEKTALVDTSGAELKEGQKCLFFAERWASVFSQTEIFVANGIVYEEEGKLFLNTMIDDSKEWSEFVEKTKQLVAQNPQSPVVKYDYIHSTDVSVIKEGSTYVFTGTVKEIINQLSDRVWAVVNVESCEKGTLSGEVTCVVPIDAVTPEKTYLFMMDKVSESSEALVITSPGSVCPIE